jgi:hypothetical protein
MKVYNKTNKIVDVLFKDQLPGGGFSDSQVCVLCASFLGAAGGFSMGINDGKIIEL